MAHAVDVRVGQRVRQRRWMLGVTQHELGALVGVDLQQIKEYESGVDHICAGQMWNIASALEVPMAYFYEGLDGLAPETIDHAQTFAKYCSDLGWSVVAPMFAANRGANKPTAVFRSETRSPNA